MESLNIIEKFGSMDVRISGSIENPLFSANDIMTKVLGYNKMGDCGPWKRIRQLPKYAYEHNGEVPSSSFGHKTQWILTERGLLELLCQSRQEIAENFKDWIFEVLQSIKKGQLQLVQQQQQQIQLELEEAQAEIEELKRGRPASVYKFKLGDRLLYIGQDKSKAQNRIQGHFTERRKIANNYQLIDIFLATVNEQDIITEITQCEDIEADQIERQFIQELEPEFNIAMNGREYICDRCNPQKIYKNRGNFERHMVTHQQ